jgi:hypothetical protein
MWNAGKKGQPGFIRNARECCKYISKPGDLLKLSAADLAKTEEALHGLHLVQPLGSLRKEISARRAAGKILVRVPTPDGCVWAEKDDWNKFAAQTEAERQFAENSQDAQKMATETATAARTAPGTEPRKVDSAEAWTRVFARLGCAVGPRGVKEPRVIVGGSVFRKNVVTEHPLVARLWAQTVQNYENGLAAERIALRAQEWRQPDRIIVHTGTPTATNAGPPDPGDPGEAWESALPVETAAFFAASAR